MTMRLWETLVPIPNTIVKTSAADGTWRGPAGESRRLPFFFNGRLAQLGERLPYKQDVIGSSPIVSRKGRRDAAFFDGVG